MQPREKKPTGRGKSKCRVPMTGMCLQDRRTRMPALLDQSEGRGEYEDMKWEMEPGTRSRKAYVPC